MPTYICGACMPLVAACFIFVYRIAFVCTHILGDHENRMHLWWLWILIMTHTHTHIRNVCEIHNYQPIGMHSKQYRKWYKQYQPPAPLSPEMSIPNNFSLFVSLNISCDGLFSYVCVYVFHSPVVVMFRIQKRSHQLFFHLCFC